VQGLQETAKLST